MRYTNKEIRYIAANYAFKSTSEIAQHLGRSKLSVYNKAYAMGIKKDAAYLSSPECGRLYKGHNKGKSTQFKKGHTPINKGKKQIEYMSPESIERTKATRFKKGHLPVNTKHDGYISTRTDKRGHKHKWIRISKANWQELHRHIWEQTYGEIPKGCNIIFNDGNSLNCDITNLTMVTNDELMYKNTIMRYPPEMRKAFRLIGKLTRKIKEHGTK